MRGFRNMKNKAIKNSITVAVSVLFAGVIVLVTACAPNIADKGAEINSIMQKERGDGFCDPEYRSRRRSHIL